MVDNETAADSLCSRRYHEHTAAGADHVTDFTGLQTHVRHCCHSRLFTRAQTLFHVSCSAPLAQLRCEADVRQMWGSRWHFALSPRSFVTEQERLLTSPHTCQKLTVRLSGCVWAQLVSHRRTVRRSSAVHPEMSPVVFEDGHKQFRSRQYHTISGYKSKSKV